MATVSELCKDLASDDQVKAYRARRALGVMAAAAGAAGKDADRVALAKELATNLATLKPAKDGRGEPTTASLVQSIAAGDICRILSLVASDAEVPTLAGALKNIDLREAARACLQRLSGQAATDALISALSTQAGTEFRVGVINALAGRTGSTVVAALKTCLDEGELEIRLAAVEALASLADPAHDGMMAAAATKVGPRGVQRVARARLRLAGALKASGQQDAAKKICESIIAGKSDEAQRKAAQAVLARP